MKFRLGQEIPSVMALRRGNDVTASPTWVTLYFFGETVTIACCILVLVAIRRGKSAALRHSLARTHVFWLTVCDLLLAMLCTLLKVLEELGSDVLETVPFARASHTAILALQYWMLLWCAAVALAMYMISATGLRVEAPHIWRHHAIIWPLGAIPAAVSLYLSSNIHGSREERLYASTDLTRTIDFCTKATLVGAAAGFGAATVCDGWRRRKQMPAAVRGKHTRQLAHFVACFVALWAFVLTTDLLGASHPDADLWAWAQVPLAYQGVVNTILLTGQSVRTALEGYPEGTWRVGHGGMPGRRPGSVSREPSLHEPLRVSCIADDRWAMHRPASPSFIVNDSLGSEAALDLEHGASPRRYLEAGTLLRSGLPPLLLPPSSVRPASDSCPHALLVNREPHSF